MPAADFPLPLHQDHDAAPDPWAMERVEPTDLITLWPGEHQPTMEQVLSRLQGQCQGDITVLESGSSLGLDDAQDSARPLWKVVVQFPAGAEWCAVPAILWAEPMRQLPQQTITHLKAESIKWVIGLETVLWPDDPTGHFVSLLRLLAKAFPDSPAIMDVNKEGWHVRDELDRDIVPEDSEVSESILWFIHAVGAEPDPASRSTVWLYTQGLHRCGWPELEMLDVPHQHAGSAMALLNGVGELLIEDGTPPPGEPFEVGPDLAITLQPWNEVAAFAEQGKPGHVEHRENHNNEKLIGVRAAVCGVEPVGTYRKVWTWPADVVKKLQQQGNTAIYKTRRATHRQERLARTTWNELAAAFASLKPAARSADENSQAIFLVQAGFQKPGSAGREHLWFAVQRIQGRRAQGRLVHPPRDIAHLREGEVIKIDPGMVSDWQVLTRQGVFGPDNVGGMKQAIQRIHEATA